jgi:hypothetical protein
VRVRDVLVDLVRAGQRHALDDPRARSGADDGCL